LTRTYQTSRLFLGLSVEDNLYLAVLGVKRGHLRPLRLPRDAELRDTAKTIAARIGLEEQLPSTVRDLSHGEQRQLEVGMALAGKPQLLLLDEPAAGLSPAERVALTDLLLRLEPEITLIIIEHDMDIALRVAQRVTMMHDGSVVVEGTPAEIRANELVHDLYLGRSHGE
jgi:branched-chain amino acid transport system ATP-binding protein